MSKEKGLSIVEMLFTILILSVIAIWSTSVFYNLQKSQNEKEELRVMQEKKNMVFRSLTKNIEKNFSNISVQDNKLTIYPTLEGCTGSENVAVYEIIDDKLLCNDNILYDDIKLLNFQLGYDDNGNGNIDSYLFNQSKDSGELESITLEIIIQSEEDYFNNKEQTFFTLNEEKNIYSNKFLQIYRNSIIKKVY